MPPRRDGAATPTTSPPPSPGGTPSATKGAGAGAAPPPSSPHPASKGPSAPGGTGTGDEAAATPPSSPRRGGSPPVASPSPAPVSCPASPRVHSGGRGSPPHGLATPSISFLQHLSQGSRLSSRAGGDRPRQACGGRARTRREGRWRRRWKTPSRRPRSLTRRSSSHPLRVVPALAPPPPLLRPLCPAAESPPPPRRSNRASTRWTLIRGVGS
ncbi:hypothetical protein ACQJBY_021119 [Aegilops geniculata]